MRFIKAIVIAFSTYSKLPMPQIKWDDEAMKLAIVFLPLVGAVTGVFVWGWMLLCKVLGLGSVLFAVIAVALPILISGGIHLDGYCDTSDALASWQDSKRKLEIMKDPNIGAFALIRCSIYLLISFGVLHELSSRNLMESVLFVYGLSRCMAVWNALSLPNAKKDGMLVTFTSQAKIYTAKIVLSFFTLTCFAGLPWFSFVGGLTAFVLCIPVTLWYRNMVKRHFGGATGDTTGFYIQIIELTLLIGILAGGMIRTCL